VIQKVHRVTQLITRYVHHILSQSPATGMHLVPFLQSSDSIVEELLILLFQTAICHADNVYVVSKSILSRISSVQELNTSPLEPSLRNILGDGVVRIQHFQWQPVFTARALLSRYMPWPCVCLSVTSRSMALGDPKPPHFVHF